MTRQFESEFGLTAYGFGAFLDKTAAYGLTGLIVGGGTAVLAKSGVFKWLWKVLVAAGIGVAALVRKLFSRNREV